MPKRQIQISDDSEEEPQIGKKASKVTDAELEQLYDDSSSRILQERNDFFLPQIRDFVAKKRWVNLRPEYQRRHRWDAKKQSKLIESLLMNVPVPPVFLYEKELNRYEVMDGQQRLASLLDFYDNKLPLTGLETWSGLNKRRYEDLPARLKRGLDRRRISAVVLLAESGRKEQSRDATDIRHEVFERLNTGGERLNQQELRNCIYSGPFNDLIVRLAALTLFRKMWGIPTPPGLKITDDLRDNKLFQTMGDCQIVLRFFAFRDRNQIKGSVKRMLDKSMERFNALQPAQIRQLEVDFKTRLQLVHAIFGESAFILPVGTGDRHSRPLFDALMIAADRLWDHRVALKSKRSALRDQLKRLLINQKYYELIVGRPNTAQSVMARIARIEKSFKLTIA